MLALLDAAGSLGIGEITVASGSVRLVDQATNMSAPPPSGLPLPAPVDLSQSGAPDVQQVWAEDVAAGGVTAVERAERGLPV